MVFFDACIAAKRNRSLLHVTKKSDASFLRYIHKAKLSLTCCMYHIQQYHKKLRRSGEVRRFHDFFCVIAIAGII